MQISSAKLVIMHSKLSIIMSSHLQQVPNLRDLFLVTSLMPKSMIRIMVRDPDQVRGFDPNDIHFTLYHHLKV